MNIARRSTLHTAAALVAAAAVLAGCGSKENAVAADAPVETMAASQSADAQPAPKQIRACDLIELDEMIAIAGKPVAATPDEGVGRTGCIWAPAGGGFPSIELKIEWGAGEAGMQAMGMLNRREPGLTSPFDGLGDEAAAVGPAVMIKRGEDLVTIVESGTEDPLATVRKVYDTASARM